MTKGKLSLKPSGNFGGGRGSHTRSFSSLSPNSFPPAFICDPPQNSDAKGESALTSYGLPLRNLFTCAEIIKA